MTHVIRTPHGLLDLRALRAWTLRNRRAAADYYAHESAANQPDRYYAGCAHCDAAKETA